MLEQLPSRVMTATAILTLDDLGLGHGCNLDQASRSWRNVRKHKSSAGFNSRLAHCFSRWCRATPNQGQSTCSTARPASSTGSSSPAKPPRAAGRPTPTGGRAGPPGRPRRPARPAARSGRGAMRGLCPVPGRHWPSVNPYPSIRQEPSPGALDAASSRICSSLTDSVISSEITSRARNSPSRSRRSGSAGCPGRRAAARRERRPGAAVFRRLLGGHRAAAQALADLGP